MIRFMTDLMRRVLRGLVVVLLVLGLPYAAMAQAPAAPPPGTLKVSVSGDLVTMQAVDVPLDQVLRKLGEVLRTRIGDRTYVVGQLKEANKNRLTPMIRIQEYLIFMLQMAAAFGLGFQVPVVVAVLATLGIASSKTMGRVRKYVWFGIAVGAAVITPSPDVTSMLLLFVPMVLLYEAGLLAARLIERERRQKDEAAGA